MGVAKAFLCFARLRVIGMLIIIGLLAAIVYCLWRSPSEINAVILLKDFSYGEFRTDQFLTSANPKFHACLRNKLSRDHSICVNFGWPEEPYTQGNCFEFGRVLDTKHSNPVRIFGPFSKHDSQLTIVVRHNNSDSLGQLEVDFGSLQDLDEDDIQSYTVIRVPDLPTVNFNMTAYLMVVQRQGLLKRLWDFIRGGEEECDRMAYMRGLLDREETVICKTRSAPKSIDISVKNAALFDLQTLEGKTTEAQNDTSTTKSATTTSTAKSTTEMTTTSTTAVPTTSDAPEGGLSKASIAGITVGVLLLVFVLSLVGCYAYAHRRTIRGYRLLG